jgi:mannose-6-phosphate isomerase-like protein (cupin superfamily)
MSKDTPFLNRLQNRVSEVVAARGDPPWTELLVQTEQVEANLICQTPGNTSRRHYHEDSDEFWIVMGGEFLWEIEGEEPISAKTGDVMRVPMGKAHNIRTVGSGPSLRLAISVPNVPHVDVETGDVWSREG